MTTDRTSITDPRNPEYWAEARDAIMNLCPFYDPNHKCGIVREDVFHACLTELREREKVAMESAARLDALSSASMKKRLELESKLAASMPKTPQPEAIVEPLMGRLVECVVDPDGVPYLPESQEEIEKAKRNLSLENVDVLAPAGEKNPTTKTDV